MFLGDLSPFGVIDVLLALAVALDFILSTVLLLSKNRDRATTFFILSAYSVTAWVAIMLLFQLATVPEVHLIASKMLYVCGILITHFFLLFASKYFNDDTRVSWFTYTWTAVCSTAVIALIIFTPWVVSDSSIILGVRSISFGWAYPLYMALLFLYVLLAYRALVHRALVFHRTNAVVARRQVIYVIVGTSISIFVSLIGNIILPYMNDFRIHWLGPVVNSSFVLIMTYAIARYKLFNLRIITTQLFVFSLWLMLFARMVLSSVRSELILNLGVLLASIIVGILLIRTVLREVETREEIQRLAKELEIKNIKLTELDKLKSQFLSIATHELRTPLTIVRNFISLMLDGTYGKVPQAVEEAGRQVFDRVSDMARSVDTYLNVSRIEQGKISYSFADADLTRLTALAVEGLKANATKRGLTLSLTVKPGAESLKGTYDSSKIAEVLINLIDNSIKYTEKGSVTVTVEKVVNKGVVVIQDTGVGMTDKTKANLFKLFSPGEDSKKINPASTGVGLYVSRAHVVAHKGTLIAASDGPGKGSKFTVELPLA